jgi:hypothetical protein
MLSRVQPHRIVFALCKSNLQEMFGIMTLFAQPICESFWKLIVYQETHGLSTLKHRIIYLFRCILIASAKIVWFQKRKITQYLLFSRSASQHVQHIFYANAIMPDARSASALLRVKRDSIRVFHLAYFNNREQDFKEAPANNKNGRPVCMVARNRKVFSN